MNKLFSYIFFTAFLSNFLLTQTDSSYLIREFSVLHLQNGRMVYNSFKDFEFNKIFLKDSILRTDTIFYRFKANINNIKEISLHSGSYIWYGAAISGAAGFIFGFASLSNGIDFGGYNTGFDFRYALIGSLIVGIPSAILGGVIGLMIPKYADYDIFKIKKQNKNRYLKNIFIKHRINS